MPHISGYRIVLKFKYHETFISFHAYFFYELYSKSCGSKGFSHI